MTAFLRPTSGPTQSTNKNNNSTASFISSTTAIQKLHMNPDLEPAFVCTICWQHQAVGEKPKLLGSSARIVCIACWRAVLDLSICWVCGECIVRGDEVVSLGWCFWHKSCFGCLICRTQMIVPISKGPRNKHGNGGGKLVKKKARGSWSGSQSANGKPNSTGVELDTIPLCDFCEVEMAGESQDHVLEKGLEVISKLDGGLSRNRKDMLSEEWDLELKQPKRKLCPEYKHPRRLRGATVIEAELKRFINGSSSHGATRSFSAEDLLSLLENAADMGVSDIIVHNQHDRSGSEMDGCDQFNHGGANHDFYVSVFDPVGEPAFRPSKTKPLPKWMQLLPTNFHRERQQLVAHSTKQQPQKRNLLPKSNGSNSSDTSNSENDRPGTPTHENASHLDPEKRGAESKNCTAEVAAKIPKATSSILFEPKVLYLQNRGDDQQECHMNMKSAYMKPREYPSAQPLMLRQRTPFPAISQPSSTKNAAGPSTSHYRTTGTMDYPTEEDCCKLNLRVHTPTPSPVDPPTNLVRPPKSLECMLPQGKYSSEYLDRYQPKNSGTQYTTYTAKQPEPILEKIKRQRVELQNRAGGSEKTPEKSNKDGRVSKLDDEEYGLDLRRSDLNKELRNLFWEE